MKLVQPFRNIKKKTDIIDRFGGFNNTENYSKNEFSFMKNISHRQFPALCPRPYREVLETLKPNGILSFKESLYTVDGTSFKKDGVYKGSVIDGKKCLIEFNQHILIFPDKVYYDTVNNLFASFASGNPDIEKATVHNNRVFGIKGANIYASKQGDFKQWNSYQQLLTDSWATDVAGAVSFKTIGTYQNHVVMQSDINMYELYGYNPSNFQVQETIKIGSNIFSYVEANSTLYFANKNGLYAYSGGIPRNISTNVDVPFKSAELGTDGRYVYMSVFDGKRHHLFVYDTETTLFTREDDLNVLQFALHNGYLLALCANGKLIRFGTGKDVFDWEIETVPIIDDFFSKCTTKRIEVHADMSPGSSISLYLKDELGIIQHVGSFFSETEKKLVYPTNIYKNCYKIIIKGRGTVRIKGIKRIVVGGGQ